MDVRYIDQSLKTKPWVKSLAIVDQQKESVVYACGDSGYAAEHVRYLIDPGNKLVKKTGAWSTGVFCMPSDPNIPDKLYVAFARSVGPYTFIVEGQLADDADMSVKRRGARKLAHAAKHDLKIQGLLNDIWSC